MNTLTAPPDLRGVIAIVIFGALTPSFSAVCAADERSKPVSVNVKFADLNISSPADALVLYNRIQRAAEGACSYWWFKTNADQNRCVHDAIANAVTRVNNPALLAIHKAKDKTPLPTTLVSQSR